MSAVGHNIAHNISHFLLEVGNLKKFRNLQHHHIRIYNDANAFLKQFIVTALFVVKEICQTSLSKQNKPAFVLHLVVTVVMKCVFLIICRKHKAFLIPNMISFVRFQFLILKKT